MPPLSQGPPRKHPTSAENPAVKRAAQLQPVGLQSLVIQDNQLSSSGLCQPGTETERHCHDREKPKRTGVLTYRESPVVTVTFIWPYRRPARFRIFISQSSTITAHAD